MSRTLTVEGDIAAVDTRVGLTTQGSITAPSRVVPSGVKKIDKIIATCASDGSADGSAVYFIRLGGAAVLRGEQVIVIAAEGIIADQAGGDGAPSYLRPIVIEDVDIEVSANDVISISAEMAGSDLGNAYPAVTLVFA